VTTEAVPDHDRRTIRDHVEKVVCVIRDGHRLSGIADGTAVATPIVRHYVEIAEERQDPTEACRAVGSAVNQYDPRRHQLGMEEPLVLPVIVYRRHVRIPE
jgi:hypothetical protein